MPWIIGFLGGKGGVGKSLNAHAASYGLWMFGHEVIFVHTDTDREPLTDEQAMRGYGIRDGRSIEGLEAAIRDAPENSVVVIDGGGNRGPVDDLLVSTCHLVILPFTADDDSVPVVHRELLKWNLPKVWAMPSNWTTNDKAAVVDTGYIEKLEAAHPGRILPATYNVHSLRDLTLRNYPGVLLTPARRYCRVLAEQLIGLMGTMTASPQTDAAA